MLLKMTNKWMERRGAEAGIQKFVMSFAGLVYNILLIFAVAGILGVGTSSIVAMVGSAGLAVGLALQGSLSNFAGGVLILLLKPFRVGDYIIEDSHKNEGTVSEISIFYTKLLTPDNKTIVIPNGTLSNSSLTNVTNMDRRRIAFVVGIAYEADIRTAKEALLAVAEGDPAKLSEEPALVFVNDLGDSAVNIGVRVWVRAEDYWEARWRLTEAIKYALDEKGIPIPNQQIDVQIKQ